MSEKTWCGAVLESMTRLRYMGGRQELRRTAQARGFRLAWGDEEKAAGPEDSLLTLELSRGPRRDSVCISERFSFKQETALHAVG